MEITNDGATILKSIGVDNPAAKILVDMSRVQDDEVGDGTTSVTVFGKSPFEVVIQSCWCNTLLQIINSVVAAELLREAEKLVAQKIHPQTIIAGWRRATTIAREALLRNALDNR